MPKAMQPDFKSIFESAPGLNLILLPDLTIVAVSDTYLQATMTKRSDIIGRHLFDIFPDNPDDTAATGVSNLRFSLNYVLEHRAAHSMAVQKYDIRKPDGTFEERYWSPINKPVLDSNNAVEYIIHRVEDVTEFMLAKKDQTEKEARRTILQKQMEEMEIETYKRGQEIQQINQQLLNEIEEREKAKDKLIKLKQGLDKKVLERAGELLKSKNVLSEILDRITDAFVALDNNWCYTYMNKKAGEIFNRDPKSMVGKYIWTEFPEGIDQSFYKAYYTAMKEQRYIHIEEYYPPYDKWFENHIYPSPEGLSIFFRDITEKKKTEEALYQNRAFIESIINASPDIIYIYDIEERKNVFVNDGMQRNLGYTEEELKQMGDQVLPILMPPEDFEDYLQNIYPLYASLKDKELLTHEFRMKHKTGSWHWLLAKESIFLRNPDGSPKQIFGVTNDITERKKAEEKLQKSEELFSGAFHASPAGIIITRITDGKIIDANESFLHMFEFSREEVLGHTSIELNMLSPAERSKLIQDQIVSGGLINFELLSQSKSGKPINLLFSSKQLNVNNELCHITSLIDITERKKTEAEIKERAIQLNMLSDNLPDTMMYQLVREPDEKMKFTYISKAVEHLTGKTAEEVIEDPSILYNLIHEDDLKKFSDAEEISFHNMSPFKMEVRSRTLSGDTRWLYIRSIPRKLKDGRVIWDGILTDISERKKAEETIKESEEKYRTLVQQAADAIFIVDQEGNYLGANESASSITGYSIDELKKMNGRDIVDAEELKKNPIKLEEIKKGKTVYVERVVRRKDNSLINVDINAKLMDNGKVIVILRDISERKKAELAIKESEEKYRTLVEQASDAIFIADTSGKFITVNTCACKMSQYSKEELLQMSIHDFAVMEDIQKNPFHFGELKQGKTVSTERVMKGKDGNLLHVGVNAKLLSDGRLLAFVRDISEHIKAQNEIIREKNLSDSIINTLPGVFYLYNREGKFLRWNKNFERVTKYSAAEVQTMHPLDFFDEDEKELLSQKIDNVFVSGEDNVQASLLLKTKEKIPYYFTGIAIDYEGSPCLMGVGIDFSERAKTQVKIKETTDQLRQLTVHLQTIREEERKRIGREIHDELGQQLTAIKMDVAWINKKTTDETSPVKSKLKNIISLLDGTNVSVRKILNELRPGILDNQDLLEALEWQGQQFTESTGIPVKFKAIDPPIKLPEQIVTCIFRVYQESLTNIMRYAEASGVLSSFSNDDNTITLTIEDDGKGFDMEFVQNKKTFGILGMKERVFSLNGKFDLISAKGKGTKIVVSIPYKN
jgi:PAS domain S-box-containing protein